MFSGVCGPKFSKIFGIGEMMFRGDDLLGEYGVAGTLSIGQSS